MIPELVPHCNTYDEMMRLGLEAVRRRGLAETGDRVVVTAGVPFGRVPGTTNLLKVETAELLASRIDRGTEHNHEADLSRHRHQLWCSAARLQLLRGVSVLRPARQAYAGRRRDREQSRHA